VNGNGALRAANSELENGFLGRVQDLVAAGISVDFLEQAPTLLRQVITTQQRPLLGLSWKMASGQK
jgi:hypothetical protein